MKKALNLSGATLIEDLEWYDGPLLSLYELDNKKYIAAWSDRIEDADIWIAAETDDQTLAAYMRNQISLREVMECSPALYEGGNGYQYQNVLVMKRIKWADVPEDRRPTIGSFRNLV